MNIPIFLLVLVAGVFSHPTPRGILDGIVQQIINDLRPKLVDLVLPNVNASINSSGIDAHLTTENITTSRLENFTVVELQTTLLPIKLNILTLNWEDITLSGNYGLNGIIDVSGLQGPIEIDAVGNALIVLKNVTLSVGATFGSPAGHLQIKEVTLLTVGLTESKVTLENLLGDEEMDVVVNIFLGFFLTEFVNDFGDDVLKALEPTLVEEINKKLAEIDFP